jgi:sigma-B regulation protein RsbU (phosphoserine phosphatase)
VQLIPLKKTGSLVGIFNENTWEVQSISLSQGNSLVLFTDGINEVQNETGDFYGNDRLTDSLKINFTPEAESFRNGILEDVQEFVGAAPRLDDITLVVISRSQENR